MLVTVRSHNLTVTFRLFQAWPLILSKNCTSLHRCKRCQRPHHTLLHIKLKPSEPPPKTLRLKNQILLTLSLLILKPITDHDDMPITDPCPWRFSTKSSWARSLLDSGSSTSFVSQRLVHFLGLQRSSKNLQITGIAGISHSSPLHSISSFQISPTFSLSERTSVTAVVVPRVTCDMPVQSVLFNSKWKHLSGLNLSYPDFGCFDICANSIESLVVFETSFGWVLAGKTDKLPTLQGCALTYHVNVTSGDDILRKFWEIEESPKTESNYSPEERMVVRIFMKVMHLTRFIVPLPQNPESKPLGESRMQAVRRFRSLERSLHSKNQFALNLQQWWKNTWNWVMPKSYQTQICRNQVRAYSIYLCMPYARNKVLPRRSEL